MTDDTKVTVRDDQVEAFEVFWAAIIENSERTFPEIVPELWAQRMAFLPVLYHCPVHVQAQIWRRTTRMHFTLFREEGKKAHREILWARMIILRWIVDWATAAQPV